MTNRTLCSVALAALTTAALPAVAEDSGDTRTDRARIGIEDGETQLEVPVERATRICGEPGFEVSDLAGGADTVACTISRGAAESYIDDAEGDGDLDGTEDGEDADRGHGNDSDGFDEDNPGHSQGVGGPHRDDRDDDSDDGGGR